MTAVDLFCGAGGFSAGLQKAGWEVKLGVDNWQPALDVYAANMAHESSSMDLACVRDAADMLRDHAPDIIVASPPCQDFSLAGHRKEGQRASMTEAWAEIVERVRPPCLLMENVPLVRKAASFRTAVQRLTTAGYHFWERVLDSSLCGAPQRRRRYFMFGWLEGDLRGGAMDAWIAANIAAKPLTVREYLNGEMSADGSAGFPEVYYEIPRNYVRKAVFTADEPAPTVRGKNPKMPPSYQRHPNDQFPPHDTRRLTPHERARLQTFPADWDWSAGKKNADLEQMIGNAVPVNMARFVGTAVREAVGG